ncbi:hypothetical protein BWI15_24905 [Kribbella sp. ALI-6-A]|uniref:sigma factor-like helix-turn-helix DNA-binding protein n=1 Tax=Kribbella sp. ALI-6-A TaxID=1933817 RepID=UPI00097C2AA8|nr:hypothetical protein BWI15_24905 [Kribbella sp. ALI-6-A]
MRCGESSPSRTRLSVKDQQVLLLNAWEGLSGSELAVALGCSTIAAGVRLHRARRRLRSAAGIQPEPSSPPAPAVDASDSTASGSGRTTGTASSRTGTRTRSGRRTSRTPPC